ncbi:hypothetical protein [Amycolatopsis sp. H20-H5]|uniref:hypothetical protein n=1 Tax=Amycolatopsis sp. H20-H5 TaxID=3046309 RepID=UPI002DBBBED2|nr:hypothetical protein [Amycolatopsis sp. H20-H5]MEC3980862.1 hypothetical protein [Amycolatopsis sp. H20-H5]
MTAEAPPTEDGVSADPDIARVLIGEGHRAWRMHSINRRRRDADIDLWLRIDELTWLAWVFTVHLPDDVVRPDGLAAFDLPPLRPEPDNTAYWAPPGPFPQPTVTLPPHAAPGVRGQTSVQLIAHRITLELSHPESHWRTDFPTATALSERYNVSPRTINTVLRLLGDDGHLIKTNSANSNRKRWIPPTQKTGNSIAGIATTLAADITAGTVTDLPPLKTLATTYSTHETTVSRALTLLTDQGFLVHQHRTGPEPHQWTAVDNPPTTFTPPEPVNTPRTRPDRRHTTARTPRSR